LLLDGSDAEADRPPPIVAKAPTTKVEAPPDEPEGPVLKPVDPEPETKTAAPPPETKDAAPPPETKAAAPPPETKETPPPETKQPTTHTPTTGIKDKLSDAEVAKGIKKANKATQSCGALPGSSYTVQYAIGNDGAVATAKIVGKGAGTTTGNCIVAAVKSKARFPKSKQPLRFETKVFTF
jgi:hypothetical protein